MSTAIDRHLTKRLGACLVLLLGATAAPLVHADGHLKNENAQACLRCHEAADLKGAEPGAVRELLKQPTPRVHRKFAKLTLEEVKALLKSFDE